MSDAQGTICALCGSPNEDARALLEACKVALNRIEWLNTGGPDEEDPTVTLLKEVIAKAKGKL